MEHQKVLKFLKIISYIFVIISYIEIAFFIGLHFIKINNLDTTPILFSDFIYGSSYISLTGTVFWIVQIISMIFYLILGFFIFKTVKSNKVGSKSLAKLMIVIGMVVLIGAFVKMNYLVLLGKTSITSIYGSIPFQTALYDFDITPIIAAIFWIYFISANCSLMIAGLVITAVGIKWSLLLQNSET